MPTLWEGPPSVEKISPSHLTLSGLAFHKLLYWRNRARLEVCAFGLCHPEHPLLITDVILPLQEVSGAFCDPDEDHLAHLINMLPYEPWRWAANWFHTHPLGMGPTPSGTDENTFASTRFSVASHSIMAIFGGNDTWSCRLRLPVVSPRFPSQCYQLETVIRHDLLPPQINTSTWSDEYSLLVRTRTYPTTSHTSGTSSSDSWMSDRPQSRHFWGIYQFADIRTSQKNPKELNLDNEQVEEVARYLLDYEDFEFAIQVLGMSMKIDRENIVKEAQAMLNLGRDITKKLPADDDATPYLSLLRTLIKNPENYETVMSIAKFPPSLGPTGARFADLPPMTISSEGMPPRDTPSVVDFTDSTPKATPIKPSDPRLWPHQADDMTEDEWRQYGV